MVTRRKHSFFPGLEHGGVIQREVRVRKEFFEQKDFLQHLYSVTWEEFAISVLEGLEQSTQPVVVETDFAEYMDSDGLHVMHFMARFTPVSIRDVTFRKEFLLRDIPLEIAHSEVIRTFWQRLRYLFTGKVKYE